MHGEGIQGNIIVAVSHVMNFGRTLVKGVTCVIVVCFFAHLPEEPLYMSMGSDVPSPRASASVADVMDMAVAMNIFPSSPSSISCMLPSSFSPQCISPPTNSCSNSPWPHNKMFIPFISRARDIPPNDCNMLSDFDAQQHMFNDHMANFSQPRPNPASLIRAV
ncbi:Zinc finger CCCH domain-containing protein 30 [Bienertia sinuspersici]